MNRRKSVTNANAKKALEIISKDLLAISTQNIDIQVLQAFSSFGLCRIKRVRCVY